MLLRVSFHLSRSISAQPSPAQLRTANKSVLSKPIHPTRRLESLFKATSLTSKRHLTASQLNGNLLPFFLFLSPYLLTNLPITSTRAYRIDLSIQSWLWCCTRAEYLPMTMTMTAVFLLLISCSTRVSLAQTRGAHTSKLTRFHAGKSGKLSLSHSASVSFIRAHILSIRLAGKNISQ